ncbi:MAG: FemAB family XrtA/PEP-CTERM system-associated protein [Pseudomonadota bacterium]
MSAELSREQPAGTTPATDLGDDAVRVRRAGSEDSMRWNAFVDAAPGASVYHRYEWRELLEQVFRHRCHYLVAEDSHGRIVGVLPASEVSSRLFGRFIVSVPYFNYCGVLAETDGVRNGLIDAMSTVAREAGADYIELRHRSGVDLELAARTDKVAMELPLPESSETLFAQFKPKLRAQIRRPSKAGARCLEGGAELLDDFYAVFSRNMRDLGTPVFPKRMFEKILELQPRTARVFVVYLDGEPAAAGLTIGYRGRVEIPVASSLRRFNPQAVNMLLYWTVLEAAIRDGYDVFDFGRSTVDSGPHRFKKQWGATPETLNWHYWLRDGDDLPQLNPSNPKFALATAVWRRLPVGLANLLGPRIVRCLS